MKEPLELLHRPPDIGGEDSLNDLREQARNLAKTKIMALPQVEQAAILAGTSISLKEIKDFFERRKAHPTGKWR